MHELTFTQSILSIALNEARVGGGKRVTRISLALGDMSGLTEESVRSCFDLFSKDSIAAGAVLSCRPSPGRESYVESIEVE